MRMWLAQIVAVGTVALVGAVTLASDPLSGEQTARAFWATLAQGDLEELRAFYADQVTLKAGSELLKPRWGLKLKGDRQTDLTVDRTELLSGYERMIGKIGQERWTAFSATIKAKQIIVERVDQEDTPFAGTKLNDVAMTVVTGPGDDKLIFVLRKGQRGEWRVVAEATDY